MAERVVVVLEAVEVEQQQHPRRAGAGRPQRVLEREQQAAAVAQARQRVRQRLFAAAVDEREVLGARDPHAYERAGDGQDREQIGAVVQRPRLLQREQPKRGKREEHRKGQQPPAIQRHHLRGARRLPSGPAEGHRGGRPQRVEDARARVPCRRPVQREPVGDASEGKRHCHGAQRAPGPPAGHGEDAQREADEEQVSKRIHELANDAVQ